MNIDRLYEALFKLNEAIGLLYLEDYDVAEMRALTLSALKLHETINAIHSKIKEGEELNKLFNKINEKS